MPAFLQEFYGFSSSTDISGSLRAKFYIWYKAGVQIHSFICRYQVVPELFVERLLFPPLNWLHALIQNQMTIYKLYSVLSILSH